MARSADLDTAIRLFYLVPHMWGLFKKRQEHDLRRLVSAYRYFLKAASQAESDRLLGAEQVEIRKWKGGFGKAFQQIFMEWPSPQQSRRFEKKMLRRHRKTKDLHLAFILAMNDYLDQKSLTPQELQEVLQESRSAAERP